MHHKRGKPKSARAGCLMCKPHKANGCNHERPIGEKRLVQRERYGDDITPERS